MAIEQLRPDSRDAWLEGRRSTIGASEISCLLGIHPYMTAFELFAIKSGQYKREQLQTKITANSITLPPTERGNLLEIVAFDLIRKLRPDWTVRPNQIPGGIVMVDREARISSTPDAFVFCDGMTGSVQVKSVAENKFKSDWVNADTGAVEPPLYAVVQGMIDAHLSDCTKAFVAPLVIGFGAELHLIEVEFHAKLLAKARELVADFWRRIEANEQYPPDFARDGAALASLYADDDGNTIDLGDDARMVEVLAARTALKEIEKAGDDAAKQRKPLDAEIISRLGNATAGRLGDGRVISAPTTRRKGYSVEPSQFRAVRIKENVNGFSSSRGHRAQQSAGPDNRPF